METAKKCSCLLHPDVVWDARIEPHTILPTLLVGYWPWTCVFMCSCSHCHLYPNLYPHAFAPTWLKIPYGTRRIPCVDFASDIYLFVSHMVDIWISMIEQWCTIGMWCLVMHCFFANDPLVISGNCYWKWQFDEFIDYLTYLAIEHGHLVRWSTWFIY